MKLNRKLLTAEIALLVAAVPAAAWAQQATPDTGTDSQALGTIVVTAEKRSEDVQEVPMSISVIGEPARSEITGIGEVSTSTSGCSGSVISCTLCTIGLRKSEMKLPRSRPMSRNSTWCRPAWMALPRPASPTSVPLE